MTEAKKMQWRKSWLEHWLDEASVELDMCAVALRQLLQQWGGGRVDEDGTGWPLTEAGAPFSLGRMAAMVKGTIEQVQHSLGLLEVAGVVVERDGAWGVVGWLRTQETPDAARLRQARAYASATRRCKSAVLPVRVGDASSEEEQRNRGTDLTTTTPTAGGREDYSPPAVGLGAERIRPVAASIGQRLALARESAATPLSASTVARLSRIHWTRYDQIEADEALPDPTELARIATALAQPAIATWPLPVRDLELVAEIVTLHRDLAVELGVMPAGSPATPSVRDVTDAYVSEPGDLATGLTLREAWTKVLTRAAEELRRELARGRLNGRAFFNLHRLAGPTRAKYLAASASDLDRRDDARAPPRGRRGSGPPQHPAALAPKICTSFDDDPNESDSE